MTDPVQAVTTENVAGGEAGANPLVDVGIPAYGRPLYLAEAIESVLAQGFADWRLTISDDSRAEIEYVQALVEPYLRDSRIRYVRTTGATGEMPNTNGLLEMADACYFAVLHDDDRMHPSFMERRVEYMEAHQDCSFCTSGCLVIDDNGRKIREWPKPVESRLWASEEFARLVLNDWVVGPPVSIFARRSAYDSAGGYFVKGLPHSDHEMFLRLGLQGPVGYLPGADTDYRIHRTSRSKVVRFPVAEVAAFPDRLIANVQRVRPEALVDVDLNRIRARWLAREIIFDFDRPGGRWYETLLLLRALALEPRAVTRVSILSWLTNIAGPGLRRVLGRRGLAGWLGGRSHHLAG